MKLIGAGLPRTATLSQKIALETLGVAPCYHMVNVLSDLSLAPAWRSILGGNDDWDAVLGGYQATVDWPGSYFYRELLSVYPDAKVLLSVRDGSSWEASMLSTIWSILHGDTILHDLSSARSKIDPLWADYIDLMKEMWQKSGLFSAAAGAPIPGAMASAMERYNEEVIATVPARRLLVWRPCDGWEPLCNFLELPVPDSPFPRVNDSNMFAERIVDASLAKLAEFRMSKEFASL